MATVILLRHGRTAANATGVLAGRTPGVALDEVGRAQAERAAERLAAVPLRAVVSSPLERCQETAAAVLRRQAETALTGAEIDEALSECDYGDWTNRPLEELAAEALWKVVQSQPSAVVFPGGESMSGMQSRAVAAIRSRDALIEAEHGPGAVWLAVSHGDVIKSILADALGLHLDLFQRIAVGPASLSIIRYGAERPEVIASNTEAGDLAWLRGAETSPDASADVADATVGGGAGHAEPDPTPSERP